jgi:hypothetical protein
MNPKERIQSNAIVTLTVIALAVRIQSNPPAQTQATSTPTATVAQRAEPSVSRGLLPYSTGSRPQNMAGGAGPAVETSAVPIDEDVPAIDEPVSEEPVVLYYEPEQGYAPDPEAFIDIAADANLPWDMSDQEVIDQMLSVLSDEQRIAFREMWSSLSSAERRDWIAQLRIAMSG